MPEREAGRGPSRVDRLLPFLLASLGPVLQFGPMLLRGEALYWGTPLLQFVPWRGLTAEWLSRGLLPLWNPLVGMGAPLLANHQSALLYPPNWLVMGLPAGWGETFGVLGHLIFAAVGMVVLLRRIGLGALGQTVGALAFGSGSYLVTRAGFVSLLATASWLPWLILASDRLPQAAEHGSGRSAAGAAARLGTVIALMVLAGHAQALVYALALSVAWSLRGAASRRVGARLTLMWMAAGLFGAALAGAQLLPTLEYWQASSRAGGLEETAALTYSFWPWRTLGLLLPGLFGSPASGDFWGYGNYWEDALYIGVLPLLMAFAGAFGAGRLGRDARRDRNVLVAAVLVSLVLALGANSPVFLFLFRRVPFFDAFNAPTRITLITTWSLSVLAAFGAELWRRPSGRGLYWARLGTAGAVAMLAVALAAVFIPSGLRPSFGRSFAFAGVWLAAAGAISLAWPVAPGRRWVALIGVLITADLAVAHIGLHPSAKSDLYRGSTLLAAGVGREHRVLLLPEAEQILKFERTHRFDAYPVGVDARWVRESGLPNTLLLDRVPSANNFDPLVSDRYAAWIGRLSDLPEATLKPVLRLMDVAWLGGQVGESPPWVSYSPVAGPSRVWLVAEAVAVGDPAEAIQRVMSAGFDPDGVVYLELPASEVRRGGAGTAAVIEADDPNVVEVAVSAPGGGWLVLSDLWYPGWQVAVDGAPATGVAANGAFRAVWVPAGSQRVRWEYRPGSVALGSGLTLLAGVAGLVGTWIARRHG